MSTGPEEDDPVLPEQTADDASGGDWREDESAEDREEWLNAERPPHWE